jgi:hydroxyquinol 1,2-dioxygenase
LRNFNENTITDAVLERISGAGGPRVKQVSEALVRHLHAFVREVRPTQKEWEYGIDFLTRTGHMCDDKRQEFILLSDTLGVSMLVDASWMEGDPMIVTGSVSTVDGQPLAGAVVDVWHSDNDGYYDVQQLDEIGDLAMRAQFRTDANGRFHFWSFRPAAYPIPHDGPVGEMLEAQERHPWRPAHVHFMISAPGFEQLVTHVFVASDKYLDSDVVFGVKDSLIRDFVRCPPGRAPDGRTVDTAYFHLNYNFGLKQVASSAQAA